MMQPNRYGRIVNISSGMGALNDMGGGSPAYRVSKASLNALTRILASELRGTGILVNSVCPGWVQTDMGGLELRVRSRRAPTPRCGRRRSRTTDPTAASSATGARSPGKRSTGVDLPLYVAVVGPAKSQESFMRRPGMSGASSLPEVV